MTRGCPISYHPRNSFRSIVFSCMMPFFGLFVVIFVSSCTGSGTNNPPLSGSIQIDGSTALLPLVSAAADAFDKQNPHVHITVSGGGSFTGLNDVTSGKVLIGDSDVYASFAAYPNPDMTDHIVCVTPFSVITNPGIQVPTLTRDQLIDIFSTNTITNWKYVGGPDMSIVPIVRPPTSGTRDTFRKYVLGGRDEGNVLTTDSTTTVHDIVAQTPGAIGYLVQAAVDNKVHPIAIDGKNATKANIIAGTYTYWSYEHMYTLGDDNPIVSAFLDFMLLSPTVRELISQKSYIPISDMPLPQASSTTSPLVSDLPSVAWYPVEEREMN